MAFFLVFTCVATRVGTVVGLDWPALLGCVVFCLGVVLNRRLCA